MKKTKQAFVILLMIGFSACNKSNESQIALTPTVTQASVGQSVAVTLSTQANVSSWTVSPSSTATKTYGVTTSKVNYFTFSQPGVYTVSVRTKNIAFDSTRQSVASAWNASGGSKGNCTSGVDTASVAITVTGK